MATSKKTYFAQPSQSVDYNALMSNLAQLPDVAPASQEEDRSIPRAAADTALQFGRGAVSGVRMMSDVFGANNAVSGRLKSAEDAIGGLLSAQAQGDQQKIAQIMAEADGMGWKDQIVAGLKAFGVAPGAILAQAAGTSLPTLATALIPGAGPAALGARLGMGAVVGAGQGVGAVKGQIYETVKAELLKSGATPEVAEARAAEAQAYSGANAGQIALGGGLGIVAGTTGAERALGALRNGVTKAAPGMVGRVGMGALTEALPEAAQGGQEKFAANTALVNEGYGIDPMRGVVAGATMEGVAGAGMGGAFALPSPAVQANPTADDPAKKAADAIRATELVPQTGTLTKAVNAGTEAKAQKVEAGAPVVTAADVTQAAQQRLAELAAKSQGSADQTITGPEGEKEIVAGAPGELLAPDELAELKQLQANIDDPQALAQQYGLEIASEAAEAAAIEADQLANAAPPAPQPDLLDQVDNYVNDMGTASPQMVAAKFGIPVERAADLLAQLPPMFDAAPQGAAGGSSVDDAMGRAPEADDNDIPGFDVATDTLNPAGKPFKTKMAADREAKAQGGEVVPIEGGFLVRKTPDAKPAETPAVATPVAQADTPAPAAVEPIPSPAPGPAIAEPAVVAGQSEPAEALTPDVQDQPQGAAPAAAPAPANPEVQQAAPPVGSDGAAQPGAATAGRAGVEADGVAKADLDRLTLPNMTDAQLEAAAKVYGPGHKRTPKVRAEIEKRAAKPKAKVARAAWADALGIKEGDAFDFDMPGSYATGRMNVASVEADTLRVVGNGGAGTFLKRWEVERGMADGKIVRVQSEAAPAVAAPAPAAPATPGAALQSAMKTEGWTAEVDSPGNTIWVKRVGGEEYTARMTGASSMEVTVLVNGVGTQIGSTATTDPKAAAKAASKAVADDVAESSAPAPSQQAQAPAEPQETTHNGTRIYRTRTKLGDEVKAMWAVETPENKARRAADERTLGGDTLHDTIEQAKTAADRKAKQYADRKAFAEQQDAEERARKEADEARKASNRGKSIAERRKETVLDGQTKLPASAGLGNTTRRNAMQMAVEQGRAVVERQVDDTAAKKRDQDAIDRVRSAGYMLGLSNENIPVVKAGLEAQARLKANDYKKPEYRVYAGSEPTGGFFEITKIEYEYAQELMAEKAAKPAAAPAVQPTAAQATHQDPGEKPEAATKGVVTDSLKTAAKNEDTKPSEMRKWLLAEIDKELLQAPDRADYDEAVKRMGEKDAISMYTGNGMLGKNTETGFITFDVPGDGKFKVRNSVRGLLEFRKTVNSSLGFKDGGQKTLKPEQNDGVQGGSGGQMAAVTNMIEEGDFEAARDYAEAVGIKLEDVKAPRGERKPQWETFMKDGTVPPPPNTAPLPEKKTADQLNAEKLEAEEAERRRPKDTGWNMAGTGYGGKRYTGRNITLADGREVVARIYENAGNYDEVEIKVDGARKFAVRDSFNAQDKADAFIKTLTADASPAADQRTEPKQEKGRMTAIPVPASTVAWMGLDGAKSVQADLQALAERHPEYYDDAQAVRKDIDFVLGKPDGWYIHKDRRVVLFRERVGEGAIPQARVEIEADADTMRVRSVYVGGKRQIAKKMADKRKELSGLGLGGQSPDSLTIAEYLEALGDGSSRPAAPSDAAPEAVESVPSIPEGYKPAGEPFYRDGNLVQGYAPFDIGQRVTMKESGGQSGVIDLFTSPDDGGVFSGAMVKFDNGVEQIVKLNKLEAAVAPAPQADTPKLTRAEAKDLMEWQDLGQKDGIKTHILTFYESKANKDAKRGRMVVATVTKGDRSATAWMVDGDDKTFGPLALAKKHGMEVGMARAVADGFVEPAAAAPEAPKKGLAGARAKKAAEELGIREVPVVDKRPAAPAGAEQELGAQATGAVENFGEKLPPARRTMAAKLSEDLTDDKIASLPLSQIWPAAENEAIEDVPTAAVAHVMREAIPAKPRVAYKVKSWVEKVKFLRDFAAKVVRGDISRDRLMEEMQKVYALRDLAAKIKLLEQIDRAQWKRIGDVSEAPNAVRYEEGKAVPSPSSSVNIDGRSHWLRGSGNVLDHIEGIKAMLGDGAPEAKMQFEIRQEGRGERKVFISKKGDKEYRRLMEFATVEEARKVLREQYADLVAAWEGVKGRDNITERDLRSDTNRERAGKDHRKGRDVTPAEFESKFGFRGGEFGKWVGQGKGAQERQFMLNSAYDALMDLSDLLGIPPKAISLEGSLGIAFGSRGSGWASAHFEPSNLVINLTKTRGAGALAHEWFHALDNYFARKRNGGEVPIRAGSDAQNEYRRNNFITHKTSPMMVRKDGRGSPVTKERLIEWRKSSADSAYLAPENWMEDPNHKQGVRAEVEQAFADLVKTLNDTPMLKRARRLDGVKDAEGYWSRMLEMAARSFENYVQTRMMEQGYHNDFLANVKEAPEVGKNVDRYPYLLPSEIAPVADAFKALFDTIQTKEDDAGNVAMFSRSQAPAAGIPVQTAQQIVGAITSNWANAPEVVVVESMQDAAVPKDVRDYDVEQRSQGASGEPEGFWYGGKAYIVAGALKTPGDVTRVLFHEALGHYGLRGVFGADLDAILSQIVALRRPEVEAKAKQYKLDLNDRAQALQAAEEVLAVMAQTSPDLGYVKRAIAAIRGWLRKTMPKLFGQMKLTDADIIQQLILPARRFVKGGPTGGPRGGVAVAQPAAVPAFSRSLTEALADGVNNVRAVKLPAGYVVNDFFKSTGKLSWWHKTIGTQYNLAQRSAPFKRVFDAAQEFINDVSYFATESADKAPTILPKLESLSDITKSPLSAADNKAIAAPIFEGTLIWVRGKNGKPIKVEELRAQASTIPVADKAQQMVRDGKLSAGVNRMWQGLPIEQYEALIASRYESQVLDKPGIVFTTAELKSMFNLDDKQVALYREFRAAVDSSLKNMALADMIRMAGKDAAPVADVVLESKTVGEAADTLRAYLLSLVDLEPNRERALTDLADKVLEKAGKVKDLMDRGYAPLSRFGSNSLDVVDANGERVYFGLFESKAEANKMARQMLEQFPGATVRQGTMSAEEFKMFAGVSPETVELFGEMLGLDATGDEAKDLAFQEYLKLSKASRSSMKRLIHRKGIAGFSEDPGRVLAGFVYSNARQTSTALNMGRLTDAVTKIPQGDGELKDAAVRLHDYVKNPQEEAQAIRGLLFAQYLGGSIASALVNMTQPVAVTMPWLSQYGGAAKAAAQMGRAVKDVLKNATGDAALDAALKKAEEDGTVSPQEVFQLQAQAAGRASLKAGDGTMAGDLAAKGGNALSKLSLAWGKLFGAAEQFNRRSTFIAAYRTAVEQKMPDPAGFARKAVYETQFIYSKANKPRWARGAVGGTLFTFKQYSIAYVELLHRMATQGGPEGKRAALLALAVLFVLSGAGGLPFAGDVDDLIDGVMQRLGYNFSSEQAKTEFFERILGQPGAQIAMRGLSGVAGVPIDISGRLGMSNLLPGTGLLLKKDDFSRDLAELAGPAGDLVKRAFQATEQALSGEVGKAAVTISPLAARNAAKAVEMGQTGMYLDTKGKKVIDVDGMDVAAKAIGFQPNNVARVQNATWDVQRMVSMVRMREREIADKWAKGVFLSDSAMVAEARQDLATWNRNNPESTIKIKMPQIVKRVREMRTSKADRIAKTAPKEVRAQVKQDLADANR